MKKLLIITLFSILLKSSYSQSLTPSEADQLTAAAKDKGKAFGQSNFTPFGISAFSNFISNISASSSFNKGQNAKAELKYNTKNWLTAGFSVDQKLGKNNNEATPFDLFEGISPGATIGFDLQKMFWNPVLTRDEFDKFDHAANDYSTRLSVDRRTVTYNQILTNGNQGELDQIRRIKLKQPIFFNIKASFTKTNYSYAVDSFSLKEVNGIYSTPSISIFIGIPFSVQSFLALGYNYSENFQAADDVTFISPFGRSNNLYSRAVAFGAPTKQIDNRISAEWRISISNSGKPSSFSIGPSVACGLASKKIAAYLPVYFINGKTNDGKLSGLQGGVRLRYITSTEKGKGSSFKEGFGAQLIITAPFDIFGNL